MDTLLLSEEYFEKERISGMEKFSQLLEPHFFVGNILLFENVRTKTKIDRNVREDFLWARTVSMLRV
ncbi:hypothetical protein DLM78_11235 [Leptospira stimsonii]|uniref:Uncharacterized protein n=1 Tax=Leptospira stimsonii TaxID=2202203 RepID=A0A8B3CTP1_9LEPT|nr:hypothetical protein DLM78_11235 [Leptospira stimsonii]